MICTNLFKLRTGKKLQKLLTILIVVLFGNLEPVSAGNFEKFEAVASASLDINELERLKKKEYQKYKRTKNKYYLYNSKCIEYDIDLIKDNQNSALAHLNFILTDAKHTETEQIAWVNYYMARTLISIDATKVGEKYALRSLKLVKSKNYPNIIHHLYNEMGLVYYKQHKYSKAAEYFRKSYLSANSHPHLSLAAASSLNDIGVAHRKMKKNKTALYYYRKAASLLNKDVKTYAEASLLTLVEGNTGSVLFDLKEYDTALVLLEKEVSYYYQHTEFLDIGAARSMIDLLQIYEIKKNQKKVDYYIAALRALELKKPDDNMSILIDECLYDYFLRNKQQAKAIDIAKRLLVNTKVSNQKTVQKLSFLSDLLYKQKIIRLKENTKTNSILLKHAIDEKRTSQLISFTITFFCLIILIFGYLFYKSIQKSMAKNTLIAKQSIQIIESINYSKKIQNALLPKIPDLKKHFQNMVVFNDPKDIVSGDFYWFKKFKNHSILACVDCTGHGVPGAFMSTIGSLAMDKIIIDDSLSPAEILSRLNEEIVRILQQQNDSELQDGMDLSICKIDHFNKQISFSGARNGITIVSKGIVKRYKADLLPVGGSYFIKGKPLTRQFKEQTIDISETDWIYMYTDGFIEQMGGKNDLPMTYSQYEEILIRISEMNSENDKIALLESELKKWRGTNERTDDILVIGFQVI